MKVYNTLTRKREDFKPIREGKIGMYVCGVTTYDICHIGHARSAVVFDVITRYLRYRGYEVTYVKNFTDVDDKIIARANAEGVSISDISERYIKEHNTDMDRLGIARPDINPRATENIPGMIGLIQTLLKKGLAYVVDADVYYAVEKFKGYGKLSKRALEDMMAGARIEVDEKKRNPLDFALWKASKEGEPWWESPWGKGRPGWHIECSAMSQRFLGDTFDIHGGGEDLIFPHHENEIAQSEGATGKSLANYWIHNGFIKINSEKMSKSLGNVFSIKDILEICHPEVLRFFIIQSHYRSPIEFSDESLAEAKTGMERFYSTLKNLKDVLAGNIDVSKVSPEGLSGRDKEVYEKARELPGKFSEAMDDDFNTARAVGYLFDIVRLANGYLKETASRITPNSAYVLDSIRRNILETGKVFGLFLEDPDAYFLKERDREARKLGLDVEEIHRMIDERHLARARRDWQKADEIRAYLAGKRIVLKDLPDGTEWKIE